MEWCIKDGVLVFSSSATLKTLTTPIMNLLPKHYHRLCKVDYTGISSVLKEAPSVDLSNLFYSCPMLTEVVFGNNFATTNVIRADHMFADCSS